MTHLLRAGLLVAALLVFIFIGLRVIPVPEFMVDLGFHPRETVENTKQWANLPVQFVSSSICFDCHPKEYHAWKTGGHRTVSCENCHGPAKTHLETGASPVIDTSPELCASCHARLVSRPSNFPQVNIEEMTGGAKCITCHYSHEPRAGMPPQVPHHLEERSDCQSCHASQEPLEVLPPQTPHTLEGRTECLSCHGPGEYRGATLPHIPHSLEGRTACLVCHSAGAIRPLPEDHFGRTSATCLICHRSK